MNALADREDWLAALAWQVELGADEAIADAPVNRFDEAAGGGSAAHARAGGDVGAAGAGLGAHRRAGVASRADGEGPGASGAGRAGHAEPQGPGAEGRPPTPAGAGTRGGDPRPAARGAEGDIPDARTLAQAAGTLEELAAAMRDWPGSALRDAARNLVFSDGLPGARLMVIGEAPGADEDRTGKPFVGRAGQLLDRMLAAIGLSRTAPAPEEAAYITNTLPWRPIGNRTPSDAEALKFLPFLERHIELARPDIILAVGAVPAKALLATTVGIKRTRGTWARHAASGLPVMPTLHPAYLLRAPEDKRLAWRDLLAVRRVLDGATPE